MRNEKQRFKIIVLSLLARTFTSQLSQGAGAYGLAHISSSFFKKQKHNYILYDFVNSGGDDSHI